MPLLDSTSIRSNPDALRRRFAEEGYLFFRGLLDRTHLERTAGQVRTVLAQFGWTGTPSEGSRVRRSATGWDSFLTTYQALQSLEDLHRIAHEPVLPPILSELLERPTFVHPGKIIRVGFPRPLRETEPHQDYLLQQGTIRTVTCWVPLADCPGELGGLRLMPGSHRDGLRVTEPALGRYYLRVAEDDPQWGGAEYQAGDVLMFHPLTVHSSGVNTSDAVRLSLDFRAQPVTDPIRSGLAMPHMYPRIPPWQELTHAWTSTEWITLPLETPVEFIGAQDNFDAVRLQLLVQQTRQRLAAGSPEP